MDGVTVLHGTHPRPGIKGPADTASAAERVVSVPTLPQEEAFLVGTVNTVAPAPAPPAAPAAEPAEHRVEEYLVTDPDGHTVTVRRDLETGQSQIVA